MLKKRIARKRAGSTAQPLKLKVARALETLAEVEGLTIPEQTVLSRIQKIHSGQYSGVLTKADYLNMARIAKKYRVKLQ